MKRFSRKLVVAAIVVAGAMGAGVAFAAWTASGSGTGQATATSAINLSVSAAAINDLYPGNTKNMTVTVKNTNPYPVHIHTIALDTDAGGITVDSGHSGCNVSSVSFNGPFDVTGTSPYTGLIIGADPTVASDTSDDPSHDFALTGAVSMSNASNDFCQGATFTINVKATGESAASPHA